MRNPAMVVDNVDGRDGDLRNALIQLHLQYRSSYPVFRARRAAGGLAIHWMTAAAGGRPFALPPYPIDGAGVSAAGRSGWWRRRSRPPGRRRATKRISACAGALRRGRPARAGRAAPGGRPLVAPRDRERLNAHLYNLKIFRPILVDKMTSNIGVGGIIHGICLLTKGRLHGTMCHDWRRPMTLKLEDLLNCPLSKVAEAAKIISGIMHVVDGIPANEPPAFTVPKADGESNLISWDRDLIKAVMRETKGKRVIWYEVAFYIHSRDAVVRAHIDDGFDVLCGSSLIDVSLIGGDWPVRENSGNSLLNLINWALDVGLKPSSGTVKVLNDLGYEMPQR